MILFFEKCKPLGILLMTFASSSERVGSVLSSIHHHKKSEKQPIHQPCEVFPPVSEFWSINNNITRRINENKPTTINKILHPSHHKHHEYSLQFRQLQSEKDTIRRSLFPHHELLGNEATGSRFAFQSAGLCGFLFHQSVSFQPLSFAS